MLSNVLDDPVAEGLRYAKAMGHKLVIQVDHQRKMVFIRGIRNDRESTARIVGDLKD